MRARLIVLFAVLLAASPAGAQEDLQLRLRQAIQRLQQGDALGALLDLEKILEQHEDSWETYYYRGRAQLQMGDDIGAHESFQRAAFFSPGDPELYYLAASAAYALADFDTAWEQSTRAVQAGYDRRAFDDMFKGMRRYSQQPADLELRMRAPRVLVTVAAPDQGEPTTDIQELALALRRSLVAAPGIALVNEASRAAYVLELTPGGEARLLVGTSATIHETWSIDLTRIPEMVAEDLVADLERWLEANR